MIMLWKCKKYVINVVSIAYGTRLGFTCQNFKIPLNCTTFNEEADIMHRSMFRVESYTQNIHFEIWRTLIRFTRTVYNCRFQVCSHECSLDCMQFVKAESVPGYMLFVRFWESWNGPFPICARRVRNIKDTKSLFISASRETKMKQRYGTKKRISCDERYWKCFSWKVHHPCPFYGGSSLQRWIPCVSWLLPWTCNEKAIAMFACSGKVSKSAVCSANVFKTPYNLSARVF